MWQVSYPADYRTWLQTMYVLFGTKWSNIFAGPMWSHEPIMQASQNDQSETVNPLNPVNVRLLHKKMFRMKVIVLGIGECSCLI